MDQWFEISAELSHFGASYVQIGLKLAELWFLGRGRVEWWMADEDADVRRADNKNRLSYDLGLHQGQNNQNIVYMDVMSQTRSLSLLQIFDLRILLFHFIYKKAWE